MIDLSTDKPGHSLRTLVWQAIREYRTGALFPFLLDKDTVVRTIAARELQVRGTKPVFEHALHLATRRSRTAREIGAFILGQLGTPKRPFRRESLPMLCKLADDKDAEVRSAAISSLGHLKAEGALQILVRAASDPEACVRFSAASALGGLRKSAVARRALRKLARDSNKNVKDWAQFELDRDNSDSAPAR